MKAELVQPKKFLNQRYKREKKFYKLFHDECLYHIRASPLIFLCKSMDWFICDTDFRHERVNQKT